MSARLPPIQIPESELEFAFIRAEGPGGQNVNKVSTAVQLRFDVLHSPSLPEDTRQRLMRLAGKRLTEDGTLVIQAKRFRSQEANRQDAYRRFAALLQRAWEKPKPRRKTAPSPAAREARLRTKKRHAEIKKMRRERPSFDGS
ncbi:MAG: alternative ribosome rescue aminoacyl-tRNA hydrolase ArfB [Anaerolineales bacterium]